MVVKIDFQYYTECKMPVCHQNKLSVCVKTAAATAIAAAGLHKIGPFLPFKMLYVVMSTIQQQYSHSWLC